MIGQSLALLGVLKIGLLLPRLLSPFIQTAESASQSTHRRTGSRAFSCITRYRAADGSQCRAPRSAFQNVRLRRLILLGAGRIRRNRLRLARVEAGLFDCP